MYNQEMLIMKTVTAALIIGTLCLCVLNRFSHVQLCATPWTVAHQTSPSMGFSRQEHWCGLPCPLPGFLLVPGIEPEFLMSPELAGGFFMTSATWEPRSNLYIHLLIRKILASNLCTQLVGM